jgi:hypothetical protein
MKIKMWVLQKYSRDTSFTCEIETEDYDELKDKSLEEVQQLIEDDEVELDPGADFNVDFVLERGEMFKDKVLCMENEFTFFEEVKD